MKLEFNDEHKANGINIVDIPDEQLKLIGDFLEGEARLYKITGIAEIEGERYHDFVIEFCLENEPETATIEDIMAVDWEWFDFIC